MIDISLNLTVKFVGDIFYSYSFIIYYLFILYLMFIYYIKQFHHIIQKSFHPSIAKLRKKCETVMERKTFYSDDIYFIWVEAALTAFLETNFHHIFIQHISQTLIHLFSQFFPLNFYDFRYRIS